MNEHPVTGVEAPPTPPDETAPPMAESPIEPVHREVAPASDDGASLASTDDGAALPTASDGFLEDLELPSLVSAPEPLAPGAAIGMDGQVQVVEHVGTRGRVNVYVA